MSWVCVEDIRSGQVAPPEVADEVPF